MRQVECGLNLTVALTVDGRVWQMGETGVASDKQALWERALVPVQVGRWHSQAADKIKPCCPCLAAIRLHAICFK